MNKIMSSVQDSAMYKLPRDNSYAVDTLRMSIGCNQLQPIEKCSVSPILWP